MCSTEPAADCGVDPDDIRTLRSPPWARRHDVWSEKLWLLGGAVAGILWAISTLIVGKALLTLPSLALLVYLSWRWFNLTRGAAVEVWFPAGAPQVGESLIVGLESSAAGAPIEWASVHLRCVAISKQGDVFVLGETHPSTDDGSVASDAAVGVRLEVPIPAQMPRSGARGPLTIAWGLVVIWKSGERPTSRAYSLRIGGSEPPVGDPALKLPLWDETPGRTEPAGWIVLPRSRRSVGSFWSRLGSVWLSAGRVVNLLIGAMFILVIGALLTLGLVAVATPLVGGLGLLFGVPVLAFAALRATPRHLSHGFVLIENEGELNGALLGRATRGGPHIVMAKVQLLARRGDGTHRVLHENSATGFGYGYDPLQPVILALDVPGHAQEEPGADLVAVVLWMYVGGGLSVQNEYLLIPARGGDSMNAAGLAEPA